MSKNQTVITNVSFDNVMNLKQKSYFDHQNHKLGLIRNNSFEKRTTKSKSTEINDEGISGKQQLDFNDLPHTIGNNEKTSLKLRKARPVTVICKSSSNHEGFRMNNELISPLMYRSVLGKWSAANGNNYFQLYNHNACSSDYLNRTETSDSSMGFTSSSSLSNAKMSCIEKNLFLGNIEAATDEILLESNAITHIISVDSFPLPRKIYSILPKIVYKHLQVSNLPNEDLLSLLVEAIGFIDSAEAGAVLVHCFRGQSRSATVVIGYLMQKHRYTLEKAFYKVKSKCEAINPHMGFLAQLKMFESMGYILKSGNVQYKMFRLFCASERMRKAKILNKDTLDKVLDVDPAGRLPGSSEAATSKSRYPMIFKCRKCKRTLASALNILPHMKGEMPNWMDSKWAGLTEEDILDDASNPAGLGLCSQSVFVTPVRWMESEIKQSICGKLYCPDCKIKVGSFSWDLGDLCKGCGARVLPAFQLDMTEIIFRTHNRYLQSASQQRGPILV